MKHFIFITIFFFSLSIFSQNKEYELIVPGLKNPWGFTFLPDNSMLISEKDGRLIHFKNGKKTQVTNLPKIYVRGQGGLMDVELHPNYKENGWIYFTFASSEGSGSGGNTTLMRAKLEDNQLINKEILYKAYPNTTRGQHFGSRITFDEKNHIYFSIGDRGNRDVNPQDITRDCGKIYRLNDDGSIPKDNPFVHHKNAKKAIYSYGHRNPQGMEMNPFTNEIWAHEHGPKGGDEINIIQKGENYGWPKVSYGINYSGTKFTDKTSAPGMKSPIHYWTPSIAPSGMAFINSDKYGKWKGNLLVGSLKFQYVSRCILKGNKVFKEVKLLKDIGRVRSIEQGLDGFIYIGVENLGIVRLLPQ
ncbi:PQQ-dependent sugar dehydrogenase [Polaribacter vadi]|uniref:PQQ-dependent sugar dehydrogenase n=1 Tax=Polaribacter TaxID=52959 RepID=UPI001C0896CC|nr:MULTISPECIES: PQQ-dependent sugar dehydrogenase [Polaribacter]MBU3012884.1 PQQ-dependent sugar dehydrogenase [Polaribacter vadi]MDO6742702.1 PQQ-dependent sugar dehydrogenase [Polaribacter sp. 1_MG-2023]